MRAICAPCGRERPHESLLKEGGWYAVTKRDEEEAVVISPPDRKGELVCSQNCVTKAVSKMLNEIVMEAKRKGAAA